MADGSQIANIDGYIVACLKNDLIHYKEVVETYKKQVKRATLKTGTWADAYNGYQPVIPGYRAEKKESNLEKNIRRPLRMKRKLSPTEE